MKVSNII